METVFTLLILIECIVGFGCPIIWLLCREKIDWEQFAIAGIIGLIAGIITTVIYILISIR